MSKSSNGVRIIHTNSHEEARRLTKEGWEPVECAFGTDGSVLGRLAMDHHGSESHREGVAVRAYRDHFGACRDVQGFVVTGAADADATFAIASLAGLLPHPSRGAEFERAPAHIRDAMVRDITGLARLVNQTDIDPISVVSDLPNTPEGRLLLLFHVLSSHTEDRSAFHAGVDHWRLLTGPRPPDALIEAAAAEEVRRIADASDGRFDGVGGITVVQSPVWGFDVWYANYSPVVVALNPNANNITVGVRSVELAEKFFGAGGLKNVFPKLGEGWGGREAIGGSPRGKVMTWEDALAAAKVIAGLAKL